MKPVLFLLVFAGTLVLFNPDRDDFTAYVQERAQGAVTDHGRAAGGELFGSDTGALAVEVAGAIAGGSVERSNYGVLSFYTLDLGGAGAEDAEWRFLGVGGQFFELERPAMLEG